jgi:hypothetical protein
LPQHTGLAACPTRVLRRQCLLVRLGSDEITRRRRHCASQQITLLCAQHTTVVMWKNSWQSQSWWFNPSVSPCASNAGWGRTKVQLLLPPMQLTQAILGLTWYIGPTPLSLHAGWPLCPREVRCPSMWAEGLHMRECSGASPESCLLFL